MALAVGALPPVADRGPSAVGVRHGVLRCLAWRRALLVAFVQRRVRLRRRSTLAFALALGVAFTFARLLRRGGWGRRRWGRGALPQLTSAVMTSREARRRGVARRREARRGVAASAARGRRALSCGLSGYAELQPIAAVITLANGQGDDMVVTLGW
jgi:hypothetical protein